MYIKQLMSAQSDNLLMDNVKTQKHKTLCNEVHQRRTFQQVI